MDLKSPTTLLAAWVLFPLLAALASAGLGAGIARLSRLELGALTLPAGWLAGMVVASIPLYVGLSGQVAVAVMAAVAIAGGIAWVRGGGLGRPSRATVLIGAAAVGAFALALAPLVGSGRSGVLGYVLNNDSVNHITIVELLRQVGADPSDFTRDSFFSNRTAFDLGYPLGVYAWPLFGSVLTSTEPFHLWSPLIAFEAGMAALVAGSVLRELRAPVAVAATGGMLVASGYLPYAYAVQGSAREVAVGVALLATVALLLRGVQAGDGWRPILPAFVGALGCATLLGLGAVVWLGPAAIAAVAGLLWASGLHVRTPRARTGVVVAAVSVLAAVPALITGIRFVVTSEGNLADPLAVGNLVGGLPWYEAFNVWLAFDYRFSEPDHVALTVIGVGLAAALAATGLVWSLRRRALALPVFLFAAVVAAVFTNSRYSIYFTAKGYPVLALAIGCASAAGVVWLLRQGGRSRLAGAVLGAVLALGVLGSDFMLYQGAWLTPKDRFEELAEINDRFAGDGPILVNDREQYSLYLLRDVQPWDTWGERQPQRRFEFGEIPPPPPRTPDFDDYEYPFTASFPLLLERRRPGGSRPPENFEPVFEGRDYRVWRRTEPVPSFHLALGARDLDGAERLRCDRSDFHNLVGRALVRDRPLRVAWPGSEPQQVVSPGFWQEYESTVLPVPRGTLPRRGGFAGARPRLEPGRYAIYLQGSYGPGVRVELDGRPVGDVFGDLAIASGWHLVGEAEVRRSRPLFLLTGLDKPWWQSGSRRFDVTGPLVAQRLAETPRITSLPPERARELCGREIDWIEVQAGDRFRPPDSVLR